MSAAAAEDFEATAIIYGVYDDGDDDEDNRSCNPTTTTATLDNAGALLRGSIDLNFKLNDLVFCREVRPFDAQKPRYRFWVLQQPSQQPSASKQQRQPSTIKNGKRDETKDSSLQDEEEAASLQFRLVFWSHPSSSSSPEDDALYDRVEIKLLSPYPHSFPQDLKLKWLSWLEQQANAMLMEEQISYSVCDFVEHKALDYFKRLLQYNTAHNVDLIVFEDHGPAFYDLPTLASATTVKRLLPLQRHYPNGSKELLHDTSKLSRREQYLIVPLLIQWKQWLPIECPICFDIVPPREATIVMCDHGFCRACLTTYLRIKADEIHADNANNPFVCPLPKCRRGMKIKSCVKSFLTEELMDKVRSWYKDIKNPPSYALDQCLKKECTGLVLRKEAVDSYLISCEKCKGRWCELCLQRAPKSATLDHFTTPGLCKADECLTFCERYLAAGDMGKQKCQDKWPWIKHFAHGRVHDESINDWLRSNGQVCPGCKTGIERLEGCFHMSCQCGTHFCYECGEEIFYPFYGTHHCWEREQRLQETYHAYEQYQQHYEGGRGLYLQGW